MSPPPKILVSMNASSGSSTKKPPLISRVADRSTTRLSDRINPMLPTPGMAALRKPGGDLIRVTSNVRDPETSTSRFTNVEKPRRSTRKVGLIRSSSEKSAVSTPVVQHFAHITVTGGALTNDREFLKTSADSSRPGSSIGAHPSKRTSLSSDPLRSRSFDTRFSRTLG